MRKSIALVVSCGAQASRAYIGDLCFRAYSKSAVLLIDQQKMLQLGLLSSIIDEIKKTKK